MATGAQFMRGVVAAFPYQIHTVLTDNGVAFTKNASTKWDSMSGMPLRQAPQGAPMAKLGLTRSGGRFTGLGAMR